MMTRGACLFVMLLLLTQHSGIYTQESRQKVKSETPPTQSELNIGTDEQSGTANLLKRTLSIDIQTAGYYELLSWCTSLGISQKGGVQELRNRLYSFYSLKAEQEKKTVPDKGKQISIHSARSTEYFSLTQVDETYIKIEGDVVLEMKNTQSGSTQKISAQKILFNQKQNLITAEGDIVYTIIEKGKEEVFKGESLSFNVDSLEGLFFEGISQTNRQIEKQEITFFFSGDEMYRSAEDVVTLSKGSITSSRNDDPYYQIKARKIWVLSSSEWGLRDAVLYVGRIPLLYIPFFFYIGDEMFFHPSFGYREVEGNFFQTTTYILGQKEKEEASLSFLQTETEQTDYQNEIVGLFLRKTRPLTPQEKEEYQFIKRTGSYIKVLFDIYTRLGVFGGLKANVSDLGILKKLSVYTGIARSRNIYIDPQTARYVPYWDTEENEVVSHWNDSYFLGVSLPFRYGLSGNITLKHDLFSITSSMETYSDPYFLRDFDTRDENIDWGSLLGFQDQGQTSTTSGQTGIKQTLTWSFDAGVTPSVKVLNPYIQTAKIKSFTMDMYWKNKETLVTGIEGLDPDLPQSYILPANRSEFSFPQKRFYYPERHLLPGLSVEIGGTLFDKKHGAPLERVTKKRPKKEPEQKRTLNPPWQIGEKEADSAEDETQEKKQPLMRTYALPELRQDLPISKEPLSVPYQHSLSYKIAPQLSVNSRLNSSEWKTPADVDVSTNYSIFHTTGSANLMYTADLFEKYLQIRNTVSVSGTYQEHFNRYKSIERDTWNTYRQQDYSSTHVIFSDKLVLKSFPLHQFVLFKNTNVNYTIDTTLFQKKYAFTDNNNLPVFKDSFIELNNEYFKAHSLALSFQATPFGQNQKFEINTILPPLDQKIDGRLSIQSGPLTSTVSLEYKEIQESETGPKEWVLQPLSWSEKLVFNPYFTFEQLFTYSFEQSTWNKSSSTLTLQFFNKNLSLKETFIFGDPSVDSNMQKPPLFQDPYSNVTSLKLWWFFFTFSAKKTSSFNLDPQQGWKAGTEKIFQPEKFSFGIDYSSGKSPFWKNRILATFTLNTSVTMDFLKFTNSLLSFKTGLTLDIYKFLTLNFDFQSKNENIYRYFKPYTDITGEDQINPIVDLAKSFNLFDIDDRTESFFNAQKISLSLVHHLHDWDVNLDISAKPVLKTNNSGYQVYQWDSVISIFVKWNPIPEIKTNITYEEETLQF